MPDLWCRCWKKSLWIVEASRGISRQARQVLLWGWQLLFQTNDVWLAPKQFALSHPPRSTQISHYALESRAQPVYVRYRVAAGTIRSEIWDKWDRNIHSSRAPPIVVQDEHPTTQPPRRMAPSIWLPNPPTRSPPSPDTALAPKSSVPQSLLSPEACFHPRNIASRIQSPALEREVLQSAWPLQCRGLIRRAKGVRCRLV